MSDHDGERIRCGSCGERFDPADAPGTFDGSEARYRCPECGRWTEGPPP